MLKERASGMVRGRGFAVEARVCDVKAAVRALVMAGHDPAWLVINGDHTPSPAPCPPSPRSTGCPPSTLQGWPPTCPWTSCCPR